MPSLQGGLRCKTAGMDLRVKCRTVERFHTSAPSSVQPAPTLLQLLQQTAQQNDMSSSPIRITASIRNLRLHSSVSFLSLSDGSLPGKEVVQAVLRKPVLKALEETGKLSPGAAVSLSGTFQQSKGRGQKLEFLVDAGNVVAECDVAAHPILSAPSNPPVALTRQHAHLRAQLPVFAATLRLRSRMENAMAEWFDRAGYTRTNPPVITSSDCEGAGEVFRVIEASANDAATAPASEQSSSNPAYLTVSAQLHLEALLLGLGRVYSFTPTFRAEDSATNRHLREFWMCEAELPTTSSGSPAEELGEIMDTVEGLIKAAGRAALGLNPSLPSHDAASRDTALLHQETETSSDPESGDVQQYVQEDATPWQRITYTEAIEILQKRSDSSEHAATKPEWGDPLSSDQEKYLCTDHFSCPTFVTDYPSAQKPFYMRIADDCPHGETVKCFDLLVPGIGELVGGSLREDRIEVLDRRMADLNLSSRKQHDNSEGDAKIDGASLDWYTSSLRRSGLPPHGGFGIGVERLVMWLAKRNSVRDCLPFPRVGKKVRY